MGTYTVLDCFSGYGGFALGLRLAYPDNDFRTVAYIEWDSYCQRVIQARIEDGHLDDAPIWGGDIREFCGKPWRGVVDIITASFPCQPFSNAGKREGEFDSKGRNLWPDTLRIIREVAPRTGVLLENVPGILVRPDDGREAYGGTVVGELAEAGYDAEWRVVSAADAGAPHLRNRWWLLAYPRHDEPQRRGKYEIGSAWETRNESSSRRRSCEDRQVAHAVDDAEYDGLATSQKPKSPRP